MHNTKFLHEDEAEKAFLANVSPRYLRLESLTKWSEGTQYDGLPGWFEDEHNGKEVPLWNRAPCIVYPIVQIAIDSNGDLCMGEGRFPSIVFEETKAAEGVIRSKPSASGGATEALKDIHIECEFEAHARFQFGAAQACGSAASVFGIDAMGKPFADAIPAKWCEPKFAIDKSVESLTIQYPYIEEYWHPREKKWAKRTKIYRRVIDAQRDVVYHPADASIHGTEPKWAENPEESADHALGFAPVVWYPFMKGAVAVNRIDGKAIHALLLDEIQAHDIGRSQWHRGALMSEPQICEFGVPKGYSPTAMAQKPDLPAADKYGNIVGWFMDVMRSATGLARKKGPGFAWQYDNPDARVELLNYPPGALDAQKDNCSDLRSKLQESLAVVLLDLENIKYAAATSGKALQAIKQRQTMRCDQYRSDFESKFLRPAVAMQLRIASRGSEAPTQRPSITWGSYFDESIEDNAKLVTLTKDAFDAGLITTEAAVRRIADVFGIEDVEKFVADIEAAQADERAKEVKDSEREMQGMHDLAAANAAPAAPKLGAPPPPPKAKK